MEYGNVAEQAKALGPWHFNIEVLPGLWTADCNEEGETDPDKRGVAVIDPLEIKPLFARYYPNGLHGKDLLDVACNAGGYCFLAHELGARSVKGIEIRDHWLEQARFVKSLKYPRVGTISFSRRDVGVFLEKTRKHYDVVLFRGMLYHLPDPIHALMGYCDLARETIVVDSACSYEVPEHGFASMIESPTHVISGVNGLAWMPGGPRAVQQILRYKGFKRVDIQLWCAVPELAGQGRMRVVGSR
jgi:2-polyprenyl-3-methyl-5-hydroxy-6-metoxy-1,4-benzoquinol methylase